MVTLASPRPEMTAVATPAQARTSLAVNINARAKRLLDLVGASVLLAASAPVMLGTAALIKLSSRGPVLFVQERVGYKGRVFKFLKFRSMHVDTNDALHREYVKRWIHDGDASANEVNGEKRHKIADDPRVFAFGRFIRKYSLDELPQLLNVLRGDMSLVGPRPALPYEVEAYSARHKLRFEGPPGLTGLWQVSGRNRVPFEEMIRLDCEYLESWSLKQDLKILLRTITVVVLDPAS